MTCECYGAGTCPACRAEEALRRMAPSASAWKCHECLLALMGAGLDDAALLGELLELRAAVQAAISTIAEKIQREHPGALT